MTALSASTGGADALPPLECDLAVVGGGILGLAVARELGLDADPNFFPSPQ